MQHVYDAAKGNSQFIPDGAVCSYVVEKETIALEQVQFASPGLGHEPLGTYVVIILPSNKPKLFG